jgi:dihydrolipoamide dehydrogenase
MTRCGRAAAASLLEGVSMTEVKHDVVVIGAGPGGYVAAIRAAQLGLDTACIDKEDRLGGTCLRVGCIPSKALLEASERYAEAASGKDPFGIRYNDVGLDLAAMIKAKDDIVAGLTKGIEGLFKKNQVTRYQGHGRLDGPGRVVVDTADEPVQIAARHVILASGSSPATLQGIAIDGDRIGTSADALSYAEVPEHLIVIGAGYIGLELGSVWRRLGARVTVVEYLDRILPGMDEDMAKEAHKALKKQGLAFLLGSRVTGAKVKKGQVEVSIDGADPVRGDRLLVAVGRVPNTAGLGLETVGLEPDDRGRIPVDEHFHTRADGIYAIGDVIRGPMLAHKAEDEGVAVAEFIATGYGHVNYDVIPGVVYTEPEVASVGKTEQELKDDNVPYRKGEFPFAANSRARALARRDGKVKILAHAETDRVLGVHIIGPRAGDLIAEAATAMEFGASSEDIARTCHAHPTLAEAIKEAALAVDGRAIHY